MNLYGFVGNNPIAFYDLRGLLIWAERCERCVESSKLAEMKAAVIRYRAQVLRNFKKRSKSGGDRASEVIKCLKLKYTSLIINCYGDGKTLGNDVGDATIKGKIQVDSGLTSDQFGWTALHEIGHKCISSVIIKPADPDSWGCFPGHTDHNLLNDYGNENDFSLDPDLHPNNILTF